MIKKSLLLLMIFNTIVDAQTQRPNIYERTCIPCHRYLPSSLERMFMSYLKTYSGELTVKASLKAFLKKPTEENSVMSDMFIEHFSVKDKSTLSDKDLEEAINIYWETYDVRNKLE
ncbi:hypothetical protein KJ680_07725 [bacterium]|nr:hypothetical protein [bacterium]